MKLKNRLIVATVAAGAVAMSAQAADVGVRIGIGVPIGPPAVIYEAPPPPPAYGYVWIPGYWGYRRPGYAWAPDRWDHRGDRWYHVSGNWQRERHGNGNGNGRGHGRGRD